MGPAEITQFLTALAVDRRVSAATQNQALAALLFLYQHVLGCDPGWLDDIVRAKRPERLPVVLTRQEVQALLAILDGITWIVAIVLYGSGVRLMECLRLRVKDVDFTRHEIVVREGKGNKDRVTMLPAAVVPKLTGHLQYKQFVESTGHRRPIGEKYVEDAWVGPFDPWQDTKFSSPDKPVVCVDFWDALAYCEWARTEEVQTFMPPVDAWEFAASEARPGLALTKALRAAPLERMHHQADSPAVVAIDGSRDNALGVSDLFGNVWEWCEGRSYEEERLVALLAGRRPQEAELCGGGFLDDLSVVLPSLRSGMLEDRTRTRHADLGFRVAALLPVAKLPRAVASVMALQPAISEEIWEILGRSEWQHRRYERRELFEDDD